ncbi:hypothetical protein PUMCH_001059 [Australozyma saopauloensis]|uniref:Uncharacterized protein n=1 Tax=Australozyma saopauloensis TaxID=291208 RepID=A0AAX4H5M0_9ASCO|nr:hypothetical protein PUMCH_001059 [[Candida] saopauloensis]
MCILIYSIFSHYCSDMFSITSLLTAFPFFALVISVFLLGFLLIGGASINSAYSSVYLLKASFNQTSPLLVQAANSSVTGITIKANYMALCVSSTNQLMCSPSKNLTALQEATTISNGPVNFSLVTVAEALTQVCKPYLLVTSIVLLLLLLVFVIWIGLPFVPGKAMASRIALGFTGLTVVVWGLGAMLQQQGVEGAREFILVASMEMVIVLRGGRAHAMAWTAFSFVLAAFLCLGIGSIRSYYLARSMEKF